MSIKPEFYISAVNSFSPGDVFKDWTFGNFYPSKEVVGDDGSWDIKVYRDVDGTYSGLVEIPIAKIEGNYINNYSNGLRIFFNDFLPAGNYFAKINFYNDLTYPFRENGFNTATVFEGQFGTIYTMLAWLKESVDRSLKVDSISQVVNEIDYSAGALLRWDATSKNIVNLNITEHANLGSDEWLMLYGQNGIVISNLRIDDINTIVSLLNDFYSGTVGDVFIKTKDQTPTTPPEATFRGLTIQDVKNIDNSTISEGAILTAKNDGSAYWETHPSVVNYDNVAPLFQNKPALTNIIFTKDTSDGVDKILINTNFSEVKNEINAVNNTVQEILHYINQNLPEDYVSTNNFNEFQQTNKVYIDSGDTSTLNSSKLYTDQQIAGAVSNETIVHPVTVPAVIWGKKNLLYEAEKVRGIYLEKFTTQGYVSTSNIVIFTVDTSQISNWNEGDVFYVKIYIELISGDKFGTGNSGIFKLKDTSGKDLIPPITIKDNTDGSAPGVTGEILFYKKNNVAGFDVISFVGSTGLSPDDINLTDYLKKVEAEATYAKITDVYKISDVNTLFVSKANYTVDKTQIEKDISDAKQDITLLQGDATQFANEIKDLNTNVTMLLNEQFKGSVFFYPEFKGGDYFNPANYGDVVPGDIIIDYTLYKCSDLVICLMGKNTVQQKVQITNLGTMPDNMQLTVNIIVFEDTSNTFPVGQCYVVNAWKGAVNEGFLVEWDWEATGFKNWKNYLNVSIKINNQYGFITSNEMFIGALQDEIDKINPFSAQGFVDIIDYDNSDVVAHKNNDKVILSNKIKPFEYDTIYWTPFVFDTSKYRSRQSINIDLSKFIGCRELIIPISVPPLVNLPSNTIFDGVGSLNEDSIQLELNIAFGVHAEEIYGFKFVLMYDLGINNGYIKGLDITYNFTSLSTTASGQFIKHRVINGDCEYSYNNSHFFSSSGVINAFYSHYDGIKSYVVPDVRELLEYNSRRIENLLQSVTSLKDKMYLIFPTNVITNAVVVNPVYYSPTSSGNIKYGGIPSSVGEILGCGRLRFNWNGDASNGSYVIDTYYVGSSNWNGDKINRMRDSGLNTRNIISCSDILWMGFVEMRDFRYQDNNVKFVSADEKNMIIAITNVNANLNIDMNHHVYLNIKSWCRFPARNIYVRIYTSDVNNPDITTPFVFEKQIQTIGSSDPMTLKNQISVLNFSVKYTASSKTWVEIPFMSSYDFANKSYVDRLIGDITSNFSQYMVNSLSNGDILFVKDGNNIINKFDENKFQIECDKTLDRLISIDGDVGYRSNGDGTGVLRLTDGLSLNAQNLNQIMPSTPQYDVIVNNNQLKLFLKAQEENVTNYFCTIKTDGDYSTGLALNAYDGVCYACVYFDYNKYLKGVIVPVKIFVQLDLSKVVSSGIIHVIAMGKTFFEGEFGVPTTAPAGFPTQACPRFIIQNASTGEVLQTIYGVENYGAPTVSEFNSYKSYLPLSFSFYYSKSVSKY